MSAKNTICVILTVKKCYRIFLKIMAACSGHSFLLQEIASSRPLPTAITASVGTARALPGPTQ